MTNYEAFVKEIIDKLPKTKVGDKFEVINSIYPDSTISRKIKNINEQITKPLALSSSDKLKIRKKEDSVLKDFLNYKKINKEKGDIIIVKEIKNNVMFCENISRPKDISETYYLDEEIKYVKITVVNIINGDVKQVKRIRS